PPATTTATINDTTPSPSSATNPTPTPSSPPSRSTTLEKVIATQSNLKVQQLESLYISSGNLSSLAVGSYSSSGNSSLPVGMPCAFYSQQSSPKLDAPTATKFPE
nr:hypothetical protein [Tanacetum cinerariifolium]GFA72756.1 hypothetical protein [Tanacetum cinerariifolium]